MTIVAALANVLIEARIRERLHAQPMGQATELMLQESAPARKCVMRPQRR